VGARRRYAKANSILNDFSRQWPSGSRGPSWFGNAAGVRSDMARHLRVRGILSLADEMVAAAMPRIAGGQLAEKVRRLRPREKVHAEFGRDERVLTDQQWSRGRRPSATRRYRWSSHLPPSHAACAQAAEIKQDDDSWLIALGRALSSVRTRWISGADALPGYERTLSPHWRAPTLRPRRRQRGWLRLLQRTSYPLAHGCFVPTRHFAERFR